MTMFKSSKQRNTTYGVYGICIAVVTAFVFSNLYVLLQSGNIANKIQYDATQKLVGNENKRQVERHARDQSQISYWDATVDALNGDVDQKFIREEIADWLWDDFNIQTTVIVGTNNKAIASVLGNKILATDAGQDHIKNHSDLI